MFSLGQYQALTTGSGLIDRSARGRLRLTGRDRRDYLQGLLTNDIAALTPGAGCYASLLTAQGRMIADMYVIETGDEVLLDLESEVTARVCAHLDQFVFTEDVQVTDVTDSLAQVGVFGPSASAVVSRVLSSGASGSPPLGIAELAAMRVLENRLSTWHTLPVTIVRRDEIGVQGFDLLIDRDGAGELMQATRNVGTVAIDPAVVEVCRVEAGRPQFLKDMNEQTIPLEAGIEDRAISLTKGCYVGQEIIIRVLHRGQGRVARRLVGLTLEPSADVSAREDRIRAGDRDVGSVTSAVWSPALQRPIALGYVHRDFTDSSTPMSIAAGERVWPAVVVTLPFARTAHATGRHPAAGRPPKLTM